MWLLLIEAGFAGFILSLFGVVWYGFQPDGRTRRALLYWTAAAILFFAVWMFALPRYPVPFPN